MESVNNIILTESERVNRPFSFSYPQELEELKTSILDYGQISPLILACVNNTLTLVSGYRRFEILLKNQIEPVVCTLKDLSIEQALSLYIVENTFTRRFNPIEKIRISHFIVNLDLKLDTRIINRAKLGDIRLTASLSTMESSLSDELREFIVKKDVTINTLARLSRMRRDISIKLLKIFKHLNLSHSEINRSVQALYILYMRGEDIEGLINEQTSISVPQFKNLIESQLNPELKRIHSEFNQFKSRFKKINIIPPENFEGDSYGITGYFQDENEIEFLIKDLEELKKIWKENPILK